MSDYRPKQSKQNTADVLESDRAMVPYVRHPAKRTKPSQLGDATSYWTGGKDAASTYSPEQYRIPRVSGGNIEDDDIVLPQADSKGATVNVKTKITPAMERSIEALLQSRAFPFACQGDFIRAAIVRLLKDCSAASQQDSSFMTVVQSQIETGRRAVVENEMVNLLELTHANYLVLMQEGEYAEAHKQAASVLERLQSCPPSVWQRRMLKAYYDRFPDMVAGDGAGSTGNATGNTQNRSKVVSMLPQVQPRPQNPAPSQYMPTPIAVGQTYSTNSHTQPSGVSRTSTAIPDANSAAFHRRVLMRFSEED